MAHRAPAIDHFEQAKKHARENGAALPLLRKMAALQNEMEARGIAPDDSRIPAYMAALVPPDSAARIAIGSWVEEVAVRDPGRRPTAPTRERMASTWRDILRRECRRRLAQAKRLKRNWRQVLRKGAPYAAPILLVAAILYAADLYWADRGGSPQGTTGIEVQPIEPPAAPSATRADDKGGTPAREIDPHFYIWLAAIWLSALGALLVLHLWRRQRLQRASDPDMGPVIDLSLHLGRANLFAGAAAEQALRQLRLRRRIASSRVDVRASLKATLAQAGYPSICFDTRRVRPEYLIFSEREMPNDHLPEVGRALAERMAGRQIDASHYEYQNRPYRLRLDRPGNRRGFEALEAVLARHEGARVLVSMEIFDVVTAGSAVPEWVARLAQQQQRPFLLNPRPKGQWGAEEALLADHGMPPVAASAEGLLSYARQVTADSVGALPPISARSVAADLPSFFATERDWLVSDHPLNGEQIEAIVDNLRSWLAPQELLWLRALALFPVIHRAFTHFSAMALFGGSNLDHVSFLNIARLPWFRVGHMPDWLREPLARGMAPDELDDAKAAVQAFFAKDAPTRIGADDIFRLRLAQNDPKKRKEFRTRMRASNLPGLSDNLLRSAFETSDPLELSIRPVEPARRPWYRRPVVLAPVAALLATAVLVWALDGTRPVAEQPPWTVELLPEETKDPSSWSFDEAEDFASSDDATATTTRTEDPTEVGRGEQTPAVPNLAIYVHIANEADRAIARQLVAQLQSSGLPGLTLTFAPIDLRPNVPSQTEVRCFNAMQCKFIDSIAPQVSDFLGTPVERDIRMGSDESAGLEIWIANADGTKVCNPGPYIVFFADGRSSITPEAARTLDQALSAYKANCQGTMVQLAGHTDRKGAAAYNAGESERLNSSVRAYLSARGVPNEAISSEAFGESRPTVATADGVYNMQNRRVEVTFGPGSGL